MVKIIVIVVWITSVVNGLYIDKNERSKSDHGNQQVDEDQFRDIINSWMEYKKKFQPLMELKDSYRQEVERFNELEVLEMIPSIIAHYRAGEIIGQDEIKLLSQIYGNLWTIIVQEAQRKSSDEMNPILKALIDSFYLTRGAINDIEFNTVRRMMKKPTKPRNKLILRINKKDHPSQRVLNTAAMLIHYDRSSSGGGHNRHEREVLGPATSKVQQQDDDKPNSIARRTTASINLQLTNIPIERITRTKRNVNIQLSGHNLILDSKVGNLLKMNGERIDSMHIADDDHDEDDDDDYDEDYNENGNRHRIDEKDEKEMMDYMYEDNYEYDEKAGFPSSDNNEYGSFRDLIYLAAKHRLRREREESKLKASKKYFLTLNDDDDDVDGDADDH